MNRTPPDPQRAPAPNAGSRLAHAGLGAGLMLAALGLGSWILAPARPEAPAAHRPVLPPPAPVGAAVPVVPGEMATRVLALPPEQRLAAAATLLIDASDRPELIVRLARKFCDEDPEHIREHGDLLILVLAETGQFETALRFAVLGGPERSVWLSRVLQLWVGKDPARAAQATLSLDDGEGFTLVANAWADRDPAGLADFVLRSSAASSSSAPLEVALTSWLDQNPATVSAWLDRL